ncbi:MAG: hypothetical protein EBR87_07695, partial [Cytophagia bacterium]|nr:hypothetical protein [Cytophagia bacterium]
MAAKNPAAPPPKMTISNVYLLVLSKNHEQLGEKKLFERLNFIYFPTLAAIILITSSSFHSWQCPAMAVNEMCASDFGFVVLSINSLKNRVDTFEKSPSQSPDHIHNLPCNLGPIVGQLADKYFFKS